MRASIVTFVSNPTSAVMDEATATASPEQIAVFHNGIFLTTAAPDWWAEEEWFNGASPTSSLEAGPLGCGIVARRAPAGFTICLVGNDKHQDVRMVWCKTEADYLAFLCGPGSVFVSACALILAADPLKRGSWR